MLAVGYNLSYVCEPEHTSLLSRWPGLPHNMVSKEKAPQRVR